MFGGSQCVIESLLHWRSPEPRPQTPDPRAQSPEPRPQNPEPRTQTPEPRAQSPEPRTQNPEPRPQNPEPRPQSPEPRTQNPEPSFPPANDRKCFNRLLLSNEGPVINELKHFLPANRLKHSLLFALAGQDWDLEAMLIPGELALALFDSFNEVLITRAKHTPTPHSAFIYCALAE
ncbi:unnamed protein product [Leuciscus chuanchicus]